MEDNIAQKTPPPQLLQEESPRPGKLKKTYPQKKVKTTSNSKPTPASPKVKRLQGQTPGKMTSQAAQARSSPRKPLFIKQNVKKLISQWEDLCPTVLTPAVETKPRFEHFVDSQSRKVLETRKFSVKIAPSVQILLDAKPEEGQDLDKPANGGP